MLSQNNRRSDEGGKSNEAPTLVKFLGIAFVHACSNFPRTFAGIAMGKFETKGLRFSAFECSLTSFKVYAKWPIMKTVARRSMTLFGRPRFAR